MSLVGIGFPGGVEGVAEGAVEGRLPAGGAADDGEFRQGADDVRAGGGGGDEVIAATDRGAGDAIRGATEAEQGGVNPAGTELGAAEIAGGADGGGVRVGGVGRLRGELDLPAVEQENAFDFAPAGAECREEPEADGLDRVRR